jgi:two-component system NtrC family sensor kinase
MKLRKKLIIILMAISATIIAIIFYLSNPILLNGFAQIEADHTKKSVERFKEIMEEEFDKLKVTSVGWSSWDDTYRYALSQPQSQSYVKNNFEISTMFDSHFSRVILFNSEKKLLFSRDYDHEGKKIIETSDDVITDFKKDVLANLENKKFHKPLQGLFLDKSKQLPEIYSINPVFPGSGAGPHVGYMVFTRDINHFMLEKFKRIMKVPIHLRVIPSMLNHSKVSIENSQNSQVSLVRIYYPDVSQNFTFEFSFEMTKKFFQLGKETIQLFLLLIVGITGILCFVFYAIFNKLIIDRILILFNELNSMADPTCTRKKVSLLGTDEIGVLSQQVNKTLETLEENQLILNRSVKFSALGEVAASIAHEINNPITVVSLQASSIDKSLEKNIIDKDDIQRRVLKIKNNVSRIEKIIKSLRFISRDAERDEFEKVPLGVIVEEIDSLFKETLKNKGIELNFKSLDTNLMIRCKPVQIAQVFINLISNSIDALDAVESKWIKVSSTLDKNSVIIKVSDSGKNISSEIAEKIMEPFFTTKPSGKGTGLGLSITKKILESHGGSITLVTLPHTEFIITLKNEELLQETKAPHVNHY